MGGGGLYVTRSPGGDHGGDTAPDSYPTITTRGRLDGNGTPEATADGDWDLADAEELFVFVHGFDTTTADARNQAYTAELSLSEHLSTAVVGYSWDSDTDWADAKRNAAANGRTLADWLVERAETDGRPTHLIGYSLGAQVCCETLRTLDSDGHDDVAASVSLLGAAVPGDSVALGGRYGAAIDATDGPVNNFHSANDRVLRWLYRAAERTRAVGSHGIGDAGTAPSGYRDVDVTDLVADHRSYVQPGQGCLPRVVDRLESSGALPR